MDIPFRKNNRDNTRCFQACLGMALGWFSSHKKYDDTFLDKISGYKKGKWTWNTRAILWLTQNNFSIIYISSFSYKKFTTRDLKYLEQFWTKEVFEAQDKMSDLPHEQRLAQKLINSNFRQTNRTANLDDIKKLMGKDYVVLVSVNAMALDNKKGYRSHMVVITDYSKNIITFHDPGLPPKANRKKKDRLFKKSMGDILAIKYKK